MKIRSITLFIDPNKSAGQISRLAQTIDVIKTAFETHGYKVESLRLATTPFPEWTQPEYPDAALKEISNLEQTAQKAGLNYLSVGPASITQPVSIEIIPRILANTSMVFCTSHLILPDGAVSMRAISAAADVICANSRISPDGFANLRYAALANVLPGSPFFPAAYHSGGEPVFALAIDGASLAVEEFGASKSMADASARLREKIRYHAEVLQKYAMKFAGGMKFLGIDFTLAPFPEQSRSIGEALERLGVPCFGEAGSLAASAFLMSILDQAEFKRTGFNGLMLPVLEDSTLAERTAEGKLSIQKLLLYSAVCGTGLDCIPLPGDITPDEIIPILLDTAALSARLKKQLTARLMPVPGKQAGEMTEYNFSYFANSRIMPAETHGLTGLLSNDNTISILPRVS